MAVSLPKWNDNFFNTHLVSFRLIYLTIRNEERTVGSHKFIGRK